MFRSATILSSLRSLEIGDDMPDRLAWRAELSALSHLRLWKPGLQGTEFDGFARPSHLRNPYVSQITPSADGFLLAVAGIDCRVEVHELGSQDSDSFRIRLVPLNHRFSLSSCAWAAPRGNEAIVTAFEESDQVYLYDLQTCREDIPTHIYKLRGLNSASDASGPRSQTGTSDMVAVSNNCVAVAQGGGIISILDLRLKSSKEALVSKVSTGMRRPVIAIDKMDLYAAAGGKIAMYDRRVPSEVSSTSVLSFGNTNTGKQKRNLVAEQKVGWDEHFNMLKVPPSAAPGCVAYTTAEGCVGMTDMAATKLSESPFVFSVREDPVKARTGLNDGVDDFGTTLDTVKPWFVKKRRGDVVHGPSNRGWKIVTPLVSRPGMRVVGFGSQGVARSFEFCSEAHFSCTHLVGGATNRLVVGTSKNTVSVLEVDMSQSRVKTEAVN